MRLFNVFEPVPPSATANLPVMDDASSLTASSFPSKTIPPSFLRSTVSLLVSNSKPLFVLRSMDNVCAIFSPLVGPVLAIPFPPVTVET